MKALDRIKRRPQDFGVDQVRPKWTAAQARRLQRQVGELRDYVSNQGDHLVDCAARQRRGETISTASSESLANSLVNRRMNKRQQIRWSAVGDHAVLTIRTDAMNRDRDDANEAISAIAASHPISTQSR